MVQVQKLDTVKSTEHAYFRKRRDGFGRALVEPLRHEPLRRPQLPPGVVDLVQPLLALLDFDVGHAPAKFRR